MEEFISGTKAVILSTPVFPYLWVPHCIMSCIGLRNTLGSERWKSFSREHPLSCFILGVFYIYPGGILSALVRGENLLSFLTNTPLFYAAFASWYLIFYSPFDFVFRVLRTTRLLPFLALPQDWQRVGLVLGGLKIVNNESPGFFLYPVVFGVLRSSGFMVVKYIEVGIMNGLKTGFRVPNQATKTMVLAAVLLQLQVLYSVFPISLDDLYCYLVMFAIVMRLFTIFITKADWDPYLHLENIACRIVYGLKEELSRDDAKDMKKKKN